MIRITQSGIVPAGPNKGMRKTFTSGEPDNARLTWRVDYQRNSQELRVETMRPAGLVENFGTFELWREGWLIIEHVD